ncbi:hypothetical protein ACIO1C_29690 [Streptomyces sp. NPDC087420]|uniref:hypothetical protein n=1 Tax=Streptomyces sp. NPDC087420 TaxID=3365785 RepID=UPI0038331CF4
MGLGDFLSDMVDGAANAANTVDRYINPLHREAEWKDGTAKEDKSRNAPLTSVVADPITNSLERTMAGLNWVYSNGISQPISSYLINTGSDQGDIFSASAWAKSWHVAEHVSPGQALSLGVKDMAKEGVTASPDSSGNMDQTVRSPLAYAKPALSSLPPGFNDLPEDEQQALLKDAGMPAIGNAYVEKLRADSDFFNYSSGAVDFAARWWLDPTILGGKAAGAAREATVVKTRPKEGWSGPDIDRLMADSAMTKAQRFLWENKDNPALVNNLTMFQKSALGPRAGGIISTLRSPEEVSLFLRTSLGDVNARGLLQERNSVAAQRLEKDTGRLSELDLALPRVIAHENPAAEALVQAQRDKLTQQINADELLTTRYKGMLAHYGELDAINLTRWSFDRAQRRTAAAAEFRTGPARGGATSSRPIAAISRVNSDDFFGNPLTMVRSFKEAHPNGTIQLDDIHPDSVAELRSQIARIPAIGPDIRQDLLNRYLKTTTEGERLDLLDEVGNLGVNQVARKHGFTGDEAAAIYDEYRSALTGGQESLRRYSAGSFPGEAVHLDEFMGHGGKLTVHPNLVTRLANDHVLIDLKALDTTLARHGSAIKALRTKSGSAKDWMVDGVDYMNHLWKFGALFRLGYIPRVLGDDIAGQIARVGTAAMAMRTGMGVKNLATNLAQWKTASAREAQEASLREGLRYADDELAALAPQVDLMRVKVDTREMLQKDAIRRSRDRVRTAQNRANALDPATTSPVVLSAHQALIAKHQGLLSRNESAMTTRLAGPKARLTELEEQLAFLRVSRDDAFREAEEASLRKARGFGQASQLHREVKAGGGIVLPPAFGGAKGEYYQKMISSDDSLRNLFATNKKMVHGNLMRSFSHSGKSMSYPQGAREFVESWHGAVNNQIMQDALALQAVKGASIEDMTHWLGRTPAGRAYRKRLGLKYTSNDRIATSVFHDVQAYLPDPMVREAALAGKADIPFLTEAAKQGRHPFEVHTTSLGENLAGSNVMSKGMDRVIDKWFKVVASMPADRMSRHPLFNQLYEGHAKTLVNQELKQGQKVTQAHADQIAETARRLALKDTRKLVFDIAHRSDAGHMLRFVSPFFSATTEAWQRWSRIIADRPQVVGYAGNFFNAPASMGWMQDADGNKIGLDGTAIDPVTGKKRLVPKGERYIMARVPRFIADGPVGKAMGMNRDGGMLISQDSMNIITQGDPWFNPGVGPVVSIPVNEFVKDKPSQGELARKLGILPFGPTAGSPLFGNTPLGRASDLALPATVKNFLTSFDTTDERYQRVKLQIMQKAAYEHANLGKPMPSSREIADMTRDYWLKSAVWSFTQPAATQRPDEYQFYRDQYNNLRRKDPLTADEQFLSRFGESYFIFAQATSKNKVGAEATKAAVELSKKYEQQLAANPELGALIIGPEGSGPFSPEAYTYQLTHPLVPGGSEMQRMKLSAEDAMNENQRRLGWAKFTKMQNAVTAQLHGAGFASFSDKGAEQFAAQRGAIAKLYGDPLLPDGSDNPYYNEQWSADFNTFDPKKYDRLVPALTSVAFSDIAENPNRGDLRSLQTYLQGRQEALAELARRKAAGGAGTLKAQSNTDLASTWSRFVDDLREKNTAFGDLHSRYLSRDLGVDVETLAAELDDMSSEEMP